MIVIWTLFNSRCITGSESESSSAARPVLSRRLSAGATSSINGLHVFLAHRSWTARRNGGVDGRREVKINKKQSLWYVMIKVDSPTLRMRRQDKEIPELHYCFEDRGHLVVPGRSAAHALSRRLSEVVTYRSVCAFI